MLHRMSRNASRGFECVFVVLIALTVSSVFTGTALADNVVLSGTHSASEIKAACGADFVADGAAYGCSKKASDGSTTNVSCNWDGQCQGYCKTCGPHIAHAKNPVLGVLSGGTLKANVGGAQAVHGAGSTHHPITVKSEKPVGVISQDHSSKKK